MLQNLRNDLEPKLLLPSLTVGMVIGIQNVAINLALAVMIFSGELSQYLTVGVTAFFLGGILQSLIVSWGSSLPGMMMGIQDSPAVINALIAAAILAAMPQASPEAKLYTVLAAIILSSVLMGAVCLALGKFRLGKLVSYMPYSVIGGFLAGTGLLLLVSALQVMTGEAVTVFRLDLLFSWRALPLWIPGVIFALALFGLVMKIGHYLVLPGVLFSAIALFYLALAASGASLAQAGAQGFLVGGLPPGQSLVRLWNPAGLAQIDLGALFGQTGSLFACVIVSLLSLLLNITALELSTGQDIDLNAELATNGWANLVGGVLGCAIGYPMLGASSLGHRLGAKSRLNGVFVALVLGGVLLAGSSLLGYFPNFVLGGLLFFIGLDFLYAWLYETWFSLPKIEYAIVVAIMLLINTVGFLQGVGVGLGLAVVLFVVQYSRTQAVRHSLSGVSYQSSVDRSRMYNQLLRKKGDWLYILELQGFLFFGTANQVLEQIGSHLESAHCLQPPRYLLLDFRLVSGIDSSAMASFRKIHRLTQAKGIDLGLTHVSPGLQPRLHQALPPGCVPYFPDLDHGIAWCEDQMVATFEGVGLAARSVSLFKQLVRTLPDQANADVLKQYLRPRAFQPGEAIIRQGQRQGGLYMIETGKVTVQLACEDGSLLRLRSLGPGNFFGEMGLYSGEPASATVVADQISQVYVLDADDLAQLEQAAPPVAAALHRFVAAYLSDRLAKMTNTVQALMK